MDALESDYYGSGAFKYCHHAYFMMTPFFDHATDQVCIRLESSRDNLLWHLVGGMRPFSHYCFLVEWDSMQVYLLFRAVPKGDTLYFY